jgi:hypothetical protein
VKKFDLSETISAISRFRDIGHEDFGVGGNPFRVSWTGDRIKVTAAADSLIFKSK